MPLHGQLSRPDIRCSSLLLLLHESFKRAAGRPLVEVEDLLTLPAELDALRCAIMIVEPLLPSSRGGNVRDRGGHGSGGSSAASATQTAGPCSDAFEVTYANQAATHMLLGLSLVGAQKQGGMLTDAGSRPGGMRLSELLPLPPAGILSIPSVDARPRLEVYRGIELMQQQQQQHGANHTEARACQLDALVCDVCSPSGRTVGRAFMFDRWACAADGRSGRPMLRELRPDEVPGPDDVQAAHDAVRAKADAVRALKVTQGLGNQHPSVQAGVQELHVAKRAAAEAESLHVAFDPSNAGLLAPWIAMMSEPVDNR